MTEKHDVPIQPSELADTVRHIAERYRSEDRDLDALAREVILQRFHAYAASEYPGDANILDALVRVVCEQVRVALASGLVLDEVDEASLQSFPASDPPAWIGRKPANDG